MAVYYLIFIFAIVQIVKSLKDNRKIILVLFLMLCIQYADVSRLINLQRETYRNPHGSSTNLTSDFGPMLPPVQFGGYSSTRHNQLGMGR